MRPYVLDELMNSRVPSAQGPGELAQGAGGASSSRTRLIGMLLGAVIAITVVASWAANQPPAPLPVSAPATAFSAERAAGHLQVITGEIPSPIGSSAGDRIRDYLVTEMTKLGMQVQVQTGVGIRSFGHSAVAGRVENIVATLPGRDSTGRIFLAAHYDSTFGTPGAADDKAAVAAVVETVRALSTGAQLRNDVVVLLTDGEEPGLLGAAALLLPSETGIRPTLY